MLFFPKCVRLMDDLSIIGEAYTEAEAPAPFKECLLLIGRLGHLLRELHEPVLVLFVALCHHPPPQYAFHDHERISRMLDALTTETLLAIGLIGVSVLVIVGSVVMFRSPTKDSGRNVDIHAAVRDAPYWRLDERASDK